MQKNIRTFTVLFFTSILIVACTSTKLANLQKIESKIFVSIPEKQLPKDNIPSERLEIKVADRTLTANWVSSDNSAPAIFILHGNGETLSDWRPLQAYLLEKGYSSFVFDYSGFGNSTGKMTVSNFNQDALEAYKTFASLTKNTNQRFTFAHSLGTSISLEVTNQLKPLPNKVIIHGAFTTLREILVEKNVIEKENAADYPNSWNGLKSAKQIKAPLYILHSKNDHTIPIYMSEALAKSAGSKAKYLEIKSTGHNDVYEFPNDSTWNQIFNFIK